MTDEKKNYTPAPYPRWEIRIQATISPGINISLNKEGAGYDDFNNSLRSFLDSVKRNMPDGRTS